MQIRLAGSIVVALVGSIIGSTTCNAQRNDVIYEGARLIIGDASSPIESGAFVVRNGHITAIGKKGAIKAPAGVAHVDLTGKTVMPAMNNIHVHLGYEGYVSWSVENHTPENVLDHMEREAFYGVGTALSMGEQPTDFAIKFQQDQLAGKFPPAARFFFAAGMAPPGGGPDSLLIQGTGPLHAVYEVSTADEAVAAVRKIAAKKIKELKFWVDNRDNTRGGMKKMPPEVYTPLIEEAHKHGMIVHAHATNLQDQKGVVKAGVDVLVHTLVAEKVDDEFIAILKEKRPYWAPVMGLGDRSELCDGSNPFIEQVLPDSCDRRYQGGENLAAIATLLSAAQRAVRPARRKPQVQFSEIHRSRRPYRARHRRGCFRQVLVRLCGAPRDRNVRQAGVDAGGGDRCFHIQADRSAAHQGHRDCSPRASAPILLC